MGQDDFNSGALLMLMWLGTIALSIGSGILAWSFLKPESFFGALGFILLWGILSKAGHFIMFGIIYAMFGRD